MTDPARQVDEGDLQAWVDGRLSPERAETVYGYLIAHPAECTRLLQYQEQSRGLRSAFAGEQEPVLPRLQVRRLIEERDRQRRRWLQIAAAIVVLLAGGVGGWTARELLGPIGGDVARMITAEAIAAHRTFAVEQRHPVEVPSAQQAHLGQWLSNRLGRQLIIPDLTALGLPLMGGRLLPSESGPAAQLMYDNGNGDRLTIYLRIGVAGETTRYRQEQDLGVLYWAEDGFACAIITRSADRTLSVRIAESVYGQLLPNASKDEFAREVGKGT